MISWIDVVEVVDVRRPVNVFGILRTSYYEAHFRSAPCGFEQKNLEHRLAIRTIGAEVTKIIGLFEFDGGMQDLIHRAVKHPDHPGPVTVPHHCEHRPSRE